MGWKAQPEKVIALYMKIKDLVGNDTRVTRDTRNLA